MALIAGYQNNEKIPDYGHPAGEVAVIADHKKDARIRNGFEEVQTKEVRKYC